MLFLSRPGREDRKILTEFQQLCARHVLDHHAYGPVKLPEPLHDFSAKVRASDPRPGLFKEIDQKLKDAGKTDLGQLRKKDAEPFIALAKTALLSDDDYAEYRQRLPVESRQASETFRSDWNAAIRQFDQLKALVSKFSDLAPIYFREKAMDLPEGGLLPFVKALDRGGWHQFICDCDWEEPDASDILPAAAWIMAQPDCDRWTAIAFLAAAQASAIDDGDRDHLDPELAVSVMSQVSDNLRDGFYRTGEFAVFSNAGEDVELAQERAANWRFPFHWDKVGDPGTIKPETDIEFHRNQPVRSFQAWLSDSGRADGFWATA